MFKILLAIDLVLTALDLLASGASTGHGKTCQNMTSTGKNQKPKVTVPTKYLSKGELVNIKCSSYVAAGYQQSNLWWAIYRGLYFTPLKPSDHAGLIKKTSRGSKNCKSFLTSTLKLRMTEDKDGVLFTCFIYDITEATQIDCPRYNNTCAYGTPLKVYRSWPLFSIEGKLLMALVIGWAVVIIPVVIFLLWQATRVLKPSKMIEMRDSGHAELNI